jgi:hypothetical protein
MNVGLAKPMPGYLVYSKAGQFRLQYVVHRGRATASTCRRRLLRRTISLRAAPSSVCANGLEMRDMRFQMTSIVKIIKHGSTQCFDPNDPRIEFI